MASGFSIGFLLFILANCVTYSSAAVASWQEEFKMEIETKMNKKKTIEKRDAILRLFSFNDDPIEMCAVN